MLPHFAPGAPNAALSALPSAQHLNAYPIIIPGSNATMGTRGHTRRRASPRARRTGCPCTFCSWQPVRLDCPRPTSCPHRRSPGLSAPERNASSQVPLRPRELRVIVTSLPASRLAAACRLRQTSHRDPGPVTLPRSGCPVRRSRHPATFTEPPAPLLPPLPAAFCGRVPRRCRDPRPQNAVPYQNNNQPINNQPRPPALRAAPCFGLRVHFGPSRAVCASRTFVYCPPCAVGPEGPGALLFTAARGSRALSACEKKAGGSAPSNPRCRARSLPPPQSAANVTANLRPLLHELTVSPGGRHPEPRRPLHVRRPRGLRRLASRWGRQSPRASRFHTPPLKRFRFPR